MPQQGGQPGGPQRRQQYEPQSNEPQANEQGHGERQETYDDDDDQPAQGEAVVETRAIPIAAAPPES